MATVVLSQGLLAQAPPGTPERVEIDAGNVRELLRELEKQVPGIEKRVEEGLSMAIDGDILSDPMLEPVAADSEVHFLPAVSGG